MLRYSVLKFLPSKRYCVITFARGEKSCQKRKIKVIHCPSNDPLSTTAERQAQEWLNKLKSEVNYYTILAIQNSNYSEELLYLKYIHFSGLVTHTKVLNS